jgi:hypothetical protein
MKIVTKRTLYRGFEVFWEKGGAIRQFDNEVV